MFFETLSTLFAKWVSFFGSVLVSLRLVVPNIVNWSIWHIQNQSIKDKLCMKHIAFLETSTWYLIFFLHLLSSDSGQAKWFTVKLCQAGFPGNYSVLLFLPQMTMNARMWQTSAATKATAPIQWVVTIVRVCLVTFRLGRPSSRRMMALNAEVMINSKTNSNHMQVFRSAWWSLHRITEYSNCWSSVTAWLNWNCAPHLGSPVLLSPHFTQT